MTQEIKTKLKRGTFQGVAGRGFYNAFLEAAWVTLGIRVRHLAPARDRDELVFFFKMKKRFWALLNGERRKMRVGHQRTKKEALSPLPSYPFFPASSTDTWSGSGVYVSHDRVLIPTTTFHVKMMRSVQYSTRARRTLCTKAWPFTSVQVIGGKIVDFGDYI